MIKIYVYKKSSGLMCEEYIGSPSEVINDMPDDCDFTLAEPKNYAHPWYWHDNKWQAEPKQTP